MSTRRTQAPVLLLSAVIAACMPGVVAGLCGEKLPTWANLILACMVLGLYISAVAIILTSVWRPHVPAPRQPKRRPTGIAQPCPHTDAVPVESAGELVAGLCPTCDRQLPAAWFTCPHERSYEVTTMGQAVPEHHCLVCGAAFAGEPVETWPGRTLRSGRKRHGQDA